MKTSDSPRGLRPLGVERPFPRAHLRPSETTGIDAPIHNSSKITATKEQQEVYGWESSKPDELY